MSIGALNVDIRVDTNSSCKNLVIQDHSNYLETPESPRIQIQIPGYNTWHTLSFNYSKTNIYNSFSFGLTESTSLSNLPDGLYTIKYGFCPYDETSITVYHIRQCQAWCKWESYLRNFIDSCFEISPEGEKLLNRIEFLLKGAEAFAKDCDSETAIAMHQKAVELLTRLECIII